MYNLDFSQEAENYLDDNTINFRIGGVRAVLIMAADTIDGLPDDPDSCYHLSETNQVYWLVEHHFVVYERRVNELYVDVVKPLA